jgi:hypothetical protein
MWKNILLVSKRVDNFLQMIDGNKTQAKGYGY